MYDIFIALCWKKQESKITLKIGQFLIEFFTFYVIDRKWKAALAIMEI